MKICLGKRGEAWGLNIEVIGEGTWEMYILFLRRRLCTLQDIGSARLAKCLNQRDPRARMFCEDQLPFAIAIFYKCQTFHKE
jgi:hypothetical protein